MFSWRFEMTTPKQPPKNPDPLELWNLGQYGVIRDLKGHLLAPEAFTDGRNVRFNTNGVSRFGDLTATFGGNALTVVPEFIFFVPTPGADFWLYASLTKVYAFDGTASTDITRAVGGDYSVPSGFGRSWNGTLLGNVPILNNGTNKPQYWTGLDVGHKLADLTAWPSTLRAQVIRAAGPFLIAFNLTDNGAALSKTIQWSSKADPGSIPASWDYTDPTVDTGRLQLTDAKGKEIIDAVVLGDNVIIYTAGSTHILRFVGGVDLWQDRLLLTESGILAPRCACNFNKGTAQAVMTADDIIIHTGTQTAQSIVEDKMRNEVFLNIDTQNYLNSFCIEHTAKKEVWFCFPTKGKTYPDLALVWNYKNSTCTFKEIALNGADSGNGYDTDSTAWSADTGNWDSDTESWNQQTRNVVVGVNRADSKAYQFDGGYTSGTVAYVERTGIAYDGKDRQGNPKASTKTVKQINRMWLKVTGSAILTVRVGSQDVIDGPVTWADAQAFDPTTQEYLDWFVDGKLMAYRIESSGGDAWTVESVAFEIRMLAGL